MLLAAECEVHEGWHVEPTAAFSVVNDELMIDLPSRNRLRTGLTGYLEDELCPCGRPGIRVMDVDAGLMQAGRRESGRHRLGRAEA